MDIIKNPVIIGLFAGTLTYAYLVWNETQKMKNKKKYKKKKINLLIPVIVTAIVWFIAYSYFEYQNPDNTTVDINQTIISDLTKPIKQFTPLTIAPTQGYKFVKDVVSDSIDPKSFTLITNGITIPTKLPEVLLEMY